MRVLIVSEHEVEELLTMQECIGVMEEALTALGRGEVHNPLRTKVHPAGAGGLLGLMPAYRAGDDPLFGLKEVCVFPSNPSRGLDTHLGAVLLHDGKTGELRAVVNAAAITAIRTAAVSAVATRLLAREDSKTLVILGSGAQSRSHQMAIPLVREIGDMRIVKRGDSVEKAVKDADIIVTATNSREPVLRGEWLPRGVHINAVGSSIPSARELDGAAMAASALFVDRRESTVNESGDYLFALREGAITEAHIRAEIGEVIAGSARGRTSADEITLFKSLGLAVEDLAAAEFVVDKAARTGRGTWVDF